MIGKDAGVQMEQPLRKEKLLQTPALLYSFTNASLPTLVQGAKKKQFFIDFLYFFGLFSKYLAPSGAKYREKGWAVTKIGEG